MKIRHLIGLLAALTLAFSGCSSDDGNETSEGDSSSQSGSDSNDGGSDTGDPADSGDPTTSIDPDALDASEGVFDSLVPEECEFLFDLSAAISLAATGQIDASEFSVDEAPEAVRGDVEVMVEAFESYDPTDPASGQVFASDEFQQASDNITNFVDENCDPDSGN